MAGHVPVTEDSMNGNKVILISIDGMRPDGLRRCGSPAVEELQKKCSYTYTGRTVFPSVTLPCHFSMTHSVTPERHGILSNTYTPQVRPVAGIFEKISAADGVSAFCYGWEPLRDIARPLSCAATEFICARKTDDSDNLLADAALKSLATRDPDFVFLYMVETDEKGGHDNGWMSDAYLGYISTAINNVKRVIEATKGERTVIVTADHGGHDRTHGYDIPEDMVIPVLVSIPGLNMKDLNIMDIAPSVCNLLNIPANKEWEGKAFV